MKQIFPLLQYTNRFLAMMLLLLSVLLVGSVMQDKAYDAFPVGYLNDGAFSIASPVHSQIKLNALHIDTLLMVAHALSSDMSDIEDEDADDVVDCDQQTVHTSKNINCSRSLGYQRFLVLPLEIGSYLSRWQALREITISLINRFEIPPSYSIEKYVIDIFYLMPILINSHLYINKRLFSFKQTINITFHILQSGLTK